MTAGTKTAILACLALLAAVPAAAEEGAAPQVLSQRAHLAFQKGDYEEAARLLKALSPEGTSDPFDPVFPRLVEATLRMRQGLVPRESEHFVVWHDPQRDWVLAEPALEALEAGYRAAGEWFGPVTTGKVRVEIVPSAEDFGNVSSLTREEIETSGAVAVSTFGKIMALSPRLLLRGYPWRDALNHEYLHHVLTALSGNRAPIWLQEGVARYGEQRWRAAGDDYLSDVERSLLARALREDALIGFDAMDRSLVRLPTAGAVRLAFAECALAVEHLLARWQVAGLKRVLAELGREGGDANWDANWDANRDARMDARMDAALRAALGVSFAEFQAGWRSLLVEKGFVEIPGVVVPEYRLADTGAAEEWDLADWQPAAAQRHLRLGDMLRRRGNARAGLLEYEKAAKLSGASPFVHLKRSLSLLELGRPADAADAARTAVRLAPAYPAAAEALAAALAALGDFAGAEAAVRSSLEINPYNPFAWRDLGEAIARQGRKAEARRPLETALRLAPDRDTIDRLLGNKP